MTIKSLLIGSAAAIVAASSAQAADAIVAADPEPVEYVQVCDTYGDGYFYIPGTETCLKFSGYVQWQSVWDNEESDGTFSNELGGNTQPAVDGVDAEHSYEARLLIEAKNDSEVGTIASAIRLTAAGATAAAFTVDRAYMTIGDGNLWTVGLIGSPWDFSIVGEQNYLVSGATNLAIGYTAAFDGGTASLYVVDDALGNNETPDVIGVVEFTAGDVAVKGAIAYDEDLTGGELGAKINLSYMGFGAHAQWSENSSFGTFNSGFEWVVGLGYGFDATDKLNIALAADFASNALGGTVQGIATAAGDDNYAVSANFTYQVAEGLAAALRLTHRGGDSYDTPVSQADHNEVRFRLTRSF
jgi:hypothetical protein